MKKLSLKQPSGNSRSPPNFSRKFGNNFFNQSPTNLNVNAQGYASVRYYDGSSSNKENYDIMRKMKHLKSQLPASVLIPNPSIQQNSNLPHSRENSSNANHSLQNFIILGNKNGCSKMAKYNLEKQGMHQQSQKMKNIKKLYGKSKSPGEFSNKFMNVHANDLVL